jgi:hypothetical protein
MGLIDSTVPWSVMISYYFMMLSVAMYGWGQTGYILWMVIAGAMACRRLRGTVLLAHHQLVEMDGKAEFVSALQSANYGS